MKKCNNCNSLEGKTLYSFNYDGKLSYGDRCLPVCVNKCLNCGLISLDISNLKQEEEQIHDYWWGQTWLKVYKAFEEKINANYDKKLSYFEGLTKSKKLLDIGCGCGSFLAQAKQKGWEATGVDISDKAIEYANNTFGVNAIKGTIFEAGFADNQFDLVTMWDVFEHLDEPAKYLSEINRILKPGGMLVIETPNSKSLIHDIAGLVYKMSFGKIDFFVKRIYIPSHLYYFNRLTLADLLSRNGFTAIDNKPPFESLFDDIDIIFSANKEKEDWAKNSFFKATMKILMNFSDFIHKPYRLISVNRKNG